MNSEHCLRFSGNSNVPAILLVPPLFDEANRMRRTLVLTMRALAEIGHTTLLPDLPGQNDSLAKTQDATLSLWRDALADITAKEVAPLLVASWRGGALIDDAAVSAIGWWRMAPYAGASIVKTLMRVRIAGEKESGRTVTADQLRSQASDPIELGGNRLSTAMLNELDAASPAIVSPLRTVELSNVSGSALWLRAEPGEDSAMAKAMAANISDWAMQCAAG
ncbi:MAG: hypothetical protein ABL874_12810 [Sphingopyxis sp.]